MCVTCSLGAGVTSEETLLSPDNKVHPDFYMPQLSDLLTIKEKTTVLA
jgi:phosphoglycolate phosphatase